jgi:beta-xylosidase
MLGSLLHGNRSFRARLLAALLVGVLLPVFSGSAAPESDSQDTIYLFAFFRGDSRDGLHFATSTDGLHWSAVAGDRSFLKPEVGEQKLMRDPSLWRGPDGTFHLVWTTAWEGRTIGYASSPDLLQWSAQRALPVMADQPACKQCWAPEVRYDTSTREFLLYWSSAVLPDHFKTYATTTKDFQTFTPARVLFDPGYAEIDATIIEDHGQFTLLFKQNGQGIRAAHADKLQGPYDGISPVFGYENGDQWEGPAAIRVGDDIIAYVDKFHTKERMGAWRTHDFEHWENITARTSGLTGIRHGSVLKVPRTVVEKLEAAPAVR